MDTPVREYGEVGELFLLVPQALLGNAYRSIQAPVSLSIFRRQKEVSIICFGHMNLFL